MRPIAQILSNIMPCEMTSSTGLLADLASKERTLLNNLKRGTTVPVSSVDVGLGHYPILNSITTL